jgi:hypothetical protein
MSFFSCGSVLKNSRQLFRFTSEASFFHLETDRRSILLSPKAFVIRMWRVMQTRLTELKLGLKHIHKVRLFPLGLGITTCFTSCRLCPSVGYRTLLYRHAAALGIGFKNYQHQMHAQHKKPPMETFRKKRPRRILHFPVKSKPLIQPVFFRVNRRMDTGLRPTLYWFFVKIHRPSGELCSALLGSNNGA